MELKQTEWIRYEGRRLAHYRMLSGQNPDFWDQHWGRHPIDFKFYRPYQRGRLIPYHVVFHRYLPKKGKILEAGCGLAQFVLALKARGYDCHGVDNAVGTVDWIKSRFPNLPIEVGDVRRLRYRDRELSGYISLGVVEHFREGPMEVLAEAWRILRAGGTMLVTVPQVHRWRGIHAYPEGTPLPRGAKFYQYAFPPREFSYFLTSLGFEIVNQYGFGVHYAFRTRSNLFARALLTFPKLSYIDLMLDYTPLGLLLGRMRMWVARKLA